MPDVPWYMPTGRFFNLELVGVIEIKDGEVTEAQLDSLKLGGWPVQEGSTEEQSTSWLEMIQDETTVDPEMRDAISRLELFQFDGEKLRLRVSGNGSSGGDPAPVESPETPEAPDPPTPEEPTQPKGG